MTTSSKLTSQTVKDLASFLLKYALLISVTCSAISFGVNWLLFAGWGLSYSVVASPLDALNGAFDVIAIFLPHGALALLGFWIGRRIGYRFSNIRPVMGLFAGLIGIVFSIDDPRGIALEGTTIDVFSITGDVYFDYMILFPLLIMMVASATIDRFPLVVYGAVTTSSVLVILILIINGFQNRAGNLIIYGETKRCHNQEYVVWAGSNQIVTACHGPPFTNDADYFIIPKENVQFESVPHKRPN